MEAKYIKLENSNSRVKAREFEISHAERLLRMPNNGGWKLPNNSKHKLTENGIVKRGNTATTKEAEE